ncbi:Triosephosphate isomerase [Desulfovibrionales bacterium]
MKKLMAANWKMYKTATEAMTMALELVERLADLSEDREVLIFPPFTALAATVEALAGHPDITVGGQNFFPAKEGAFTGEIAPGMLLAAGCVYGLTGHSERRYIIGESDEFVGRKTAFGLEHGLNIVLCIGEKIKERESGQLEVVLTRQLVTSLANVPKDISPEALVVAYEPVWAIGTGKVAGSEEILEAHATIRRLLTGLFSDTGIDIRILYGGSVNQDNCNEIIMLDNVDGVLVGGASLQIENFSRIVLT